MPRASFRSFLLSCADSAAFMLGGDTGANNLFGGVGADVILGRGGNDVVEGGDGADHLDGGTGNDTLEYGASTEGVFLNLDNGQVFGGEAQGDTITGFENILGSGHGARPRAPLSAQLSSS